MPRERWFGNVPEDLSSKLAFRRLAVREGKVVLFARSRARASFRLGGLDRETFWPNGPLGVGCGVFWNPKILVSA